MSIKRKRILVTGHKGFLGQYLCSQLERNGYSLVNPLRNYDIANFDSVAETFSCEKIDYIFHLAGISSVQVCEENPKAAFDTNVAGTWNILEIAKEKHVEGFFLASTVRLNRKEGTNDEHGVYNTSKLCSERIALSYKKKYGLPVTAIRFGSIFGESDWNRDKLITYVIQSLINKEIPVIKSRINSTNYYIYLQDAVEACLFLLKKISKIDVKDSIVTLAYKEPETLKALVAKLIKISTMPSLYPISIDSLPDKKPCEIIKTIKHIEDLGWKPQYTLFDALKKTFEMNKSKKL